MAREAWDAEATVLLVTLEQSELVTLGARRVAVPIDERAEGRCFATGLPVEDERTWVPLSHRGERLGVLGVASPLPIDPADLGAYADALALHLTASRGTSDLLETVRRTQETSVGAELLAAILPPAAYGDRQVSIATVMEPTYGQGGDALDYSVDDGTVHAMVLDATGHGFRAALVSAVAVAAHRSARRAGQDLSGTWALMDRAVGDAGHDLRYATALLVELRLDTGHVTWLSAGHQPPVVLRATGAVDELAGDPATPLGTGLGVEPDVFEDYLEPGDSLVLHTDGLTEVRDLDGRMLGLDGFLATLAAEIDRGGSLAERLRRLRLDLLASDESWLSDDATLMLVQWLGE